MTTKADFTAEEWAQLTQAPLMATMAIVAADMSGPIGLVKEMMATVKTIQETAASTTAGELVKAISTDVIESQQKKDQKDQKDQGAQPAGDASAQPVTDASAQPAVSSPDPMQSMKIDAKNPEEAKKKAAEGCVAATAIVTQKSPGEADEFKQWLMTIATRTAEAGKEGGFLGIGGTRVSEKEKTELAALASALGVSAA
jgi:hypothetical protein